MRTILRIFLFVTGLSLFAGQLMAQNENFRDTKLGVDERVAALLKQLTLEEKIELLGFDNQGVERLGVHRYNWWNEALHGVARAGEATVFPQAIAMAATFDDQLINQVADAISTEARAKYNLAVARGNREQYMGLTFWSPNVNIFRDPRWGRGQETYGEDPYLTSRMGVAFIKGIQGDDPNYLKASACAKHFAAHSGPEYNRHTFNAVVDEKDLHETYLVAFKAMVDAGVESVMCGYNRLNGEPACLSPYLLQKTLKDEWGFKGHVVTDCWALEDIWLRHKVRPNSVVVTAEAIKEGINLDCSNMLQDDAMKAIEQGLITEADVDKALAPNLKTQFKLGFYDPQEDSPFYNLGAAEVHSTGHVALSREAAEESMVLIKNDNNLLPLHIEDYKSILVTGANSGSLDALLANYHGISSELVTFAEGISKAAGPAVAVQYDLGCNDTDTVHFGGVWASGMSDVTIVVIGLTPVREGEEGDAFLAEHGGDKKDLNIPPAHIAFLKKLRASHDRPIITVVTGGSAVDLSEIQANSDAVIFSWYPGEQGGNALADIVFGQVAPSGRLPITFYKSFDQLPDYESYDMQGRTYRYFDGEVQYPFAYGLSYVTFDYTWKQAPAKKYKTGDKISLSVTVKNTGEMDAKEVVPVFISYPSADRMPVKELKQFTKKEITAGGEQTISFEIPVWDLAKWDESCGDWKVFPGDYEVMVGGDAKTAKLSAKFQIK
ncbi:glycoside hydrolase family 3 N-terminal domain-containing protein [Mangrovibacterium lignilyticum]|uniref:glycoside hydrolase family 3 N-terminal domain-containing protein n=1 Tax=Mangrovibacterium lignilyticum TaxID=2668052 RepID=UPI0013D429C7|nr:glycoside hydrolase family 3 N-terminal domain-containing protein [Mangrovibacterium lignilyticum]